MTQSDAYSQAGVNIEAGHRATELMKDAVRSTYGKEVLSETGAFGGLFSALALKSMESPVLVASTDGVGTKTMVAAKMGKWDTIGQDLVNHCINDILVQGAKPLFFLDYVASSQLVPEQIADVVRGCAIACKQSGVALLGGETAEMPGVYQTGELDLVGTVVGVVDKASILDGSSVELGNVIINLPSSGLHTNGYSLARKTLADFDWQEPRDDLNGEAIGNVLLNVHRCYLNDVQKLQLTGIDIRGLAHITGGGVLDNLPRILPNNRRALINQKLWTVPPIFNLIQNTGEIADNDMFHAFNMGLGMLIIVPNEQAQTVLDTLPDFAEVVGEIIEGETGVEL